MLQQNSTRMDAIIFCQVAAVVIVATIGATHVAESLGNAAVLLKDPLTVVWKVRRVF